MPFNRLSQHPIISWWWRIDRYCLAAIGLIILFGTLLVATASPAIAERIGFGQFYFLKRHLIFLFLSIMLMITVSFVPVKTIKRFSLLAYIGGILALILVMLAGQDVNGAKRWLSIGGISLQPSEFMKPIFIIFTAWLLSQAKTREGFAGFRLSFMSYVLLVAFLVTQPDLGMTIVISAVWAAQWFLAGIEMLWIMIFVVIGLLGLLLAYLCLPHVAQRIDSFISPSQHSNYQVQKSLESFNNGGLTGTGPGEGVVKQHLPDSHTDFIFAVAGEELGAFVCLLIVGLYGFIILRGLLRMMEEQDLFIMFSVSGLLIQFGGQAMINMGVAVNLLPTKGMTLPFISYGGSSMLAMGLAMGLLLALTKRRYGNILIKKKLYA